MTDRLDDQLAEAGQLLRDWRDEHEALGRTATGEGALTLTSALPAPDRRWMFGAAAAFVLLAGAVAVVAWNRADDNVPVATEWGTVALVPSSVDGWDQVSIQDPADAEPHESELNEVIVARTDSDPMDGQVVRLSTFEADGSTTPEGPGEPVEVGDRDGWLTEGPNGVRFLAVLPTDGQTAVVTATSGPNVSAGDLLELADAFVADRPLAEQPIPSGWVVKADGRDLLDVVQRGFSLGRGGDTSTSFGYTVSVASVTGISPEQVLWYLRWQPTEIVEVRGVEGLIFYTPSDGHSYGLLTWIEHEGMAVVISYSSDSPEMDGEAVLLSVAEDLVAVDAAGWEEFARQATGATGDSDGTGPDTTLELDGEVPTGSVPVTISGGDPEMSLEAVMSLGLGNGSEVAVNLYSDATVCWTIVDANDGQVCVGASGSAGPDGQLPPQLVFDRDGTPLFIYGRLSADAASVRVRPASSEAPSAPEGTTTRTIDRVWASSMLVRGEQVIVEAVGDDGLVLDEFRVDVP